MFKIIEKEELAHTIYMMRLVVPDIASKARAGQFLVIRLNETGERIPLTIADYDCDNGTIDIVFQVVGKTTEQLSCMEIGDSIQDIAGPMGKASHIPQDEKVVVVGGGVGIAPIYPITRAFHEAGNHVIGIIGARSENLLIYEDKMKEVCDEFHLTTDDGTKGRCSLVTAPLTEVLEKNKDVKLVVVIGPGIMMKCCAEATKPFGVKTMVSLNSIMVDGTGMCGACRVEVGGETKFACADGPEFDGHQVNFGLLMDRLRAYTGKEKQALDDFHSKDGCKCQTK